MREIKFRAWHTFGKTMYQDVLTGMREGEQQYWAWLKDPLKNEHLAWIGTCCEIMQYTGLKDKNGREIYEGDIVQWNKPHGSKAEVKFGEWSNGLEYEAYDGGIGWYVEFTHEGEANISGLEPGSVEVIGNIYKNPELLK